jgi:hypothetical protein
VLHVCYSFHQKCSKLHTFIDQGPNILETGTKFKILVLNCPFRVPQNQVCGSGSGLDPDSEILWIRIRIGNPDPDPWARKMKEKNTIFFNFLNIFIAFQGRK